MTNIPPEEQEDYPFALSVKHTEECHARWPGNRHYSQEMHDKLGQMPDHWISNQCGKCRFFIPLSGAFAADYGVCSSRESAFDGRAMFEHDGCDFFADAGGWITKIMKSSGDIKSQPTK